MGTKSEELQKLELGQGCLGKAALDEPIFVLRAKDKLAPLMVEHWAQLAEALGAPGPKTYEAYNLAVQMRNWQRRNADKVKLPD